MLNPAERNRAIARLKSAAAGEAQPVRVERDDLRALLASHAALVKAATMTERLTGTTPEARAAIEAARIAARAARGLT